MFKYIAVFCVVVLGSMDVAWAQAGAGPPGYGWFPFVLPPFDTTSSATDVSWLNNAPAGQDGFIRSEGEHFLDGKGNPIRFWGANISFSGTFPSKEQAPKIAARLAKYGFNAVRIHNYEGYAGVNGIWVPNVTGSSRAKIPRQFDPQQLDKLDFFVAQLIKKGIYVNINLHVGRKVVAGEGVQHATALPEKDKGVDYYDPQLIELQKEFARQLLLHQNPYTGRSYAAEPGMCAVEVTNEDSLLGLWLDGSLNQLPEKVTRPLQEKWNRWLQQHYDEESLRTAWHESSEPLQPVDVLALPYPRTVINPHAPDSRIKIGLATLQRFRFQDPRNAGGSIDVDALGGPTVEGAVRPGMNVFLRSSSNNRWGYRLNRDGLDLREGQAYTLSFWARSSTDRRISVSLWQDRSPFQFAGFTGSADVGRDWQHYTFVFRPADVEPEHSRLSFNFGKQSGSVQLGEVTLHAGGQLTVPKNWTLAEGVPLIDVKTTQVWRARRDFAHFLGDIEAEYSREMQDFLRQELQVQCPIWISQAQFGALGGLWRESKTDAIDVHAYWKHPIFSGGDWTGNSWTVGNVSMIGAAQNNPLAAFGHLRLAGKPFVMSEWNSGQPSNFGAETLPLIAAYAAWQDWSSVYLFDYHSSGDYDRDEITGYFSIDSNPAKMATAPAAALMYRRGDVTAARQQITLTMPSDEVWFNVANSPGPPAATPFVRLWKNAGAPAAAALEYQLKMQFGEAAFPVPSRAALPAPHKSTFVSDTREIKWDKTAQLFTVNTPSSKAVAGIGGTRPIALGAWRVTPPLGQYAVIMLSAMDGKDISSSQRLIVTALTDAQNQATRWNATADSVTNWGIGPTYVRGVNAQLQLATSRTKLKVWALDATGKRQTEVPSTYRNGVLTFKASPQWKAVWYEIAEAR